MPMKWDIAKIWTQHFLLRWFLTSYLPSHLSNQVINADLITEVGWWICWLYMKTGVPCQALAPKLVTHESGGCRSSSLMCNHGAPGAWGWTGERLKFRLPPPCPLWKFRCVQIPDLFKIPPPHPTSPSPTPRERERMPNIFILDKTDSGNEVVCRAHFHCINGCVAFAPLVFSAWANFPLSRTVIRHISCSLWQAAPLIPLFDCMNRKCPYGNNTQGGYQAIFSARFTLRKCVVVAAESDLSITGSIPSAWYIRAAKMLLKEYRICMPMTVDEVSWDFRYSGVVNFPVSFSRPILLYGT